MPALSHPDEDFINKSLLASLDAQADAEPSDDHHHQPNDHEQTNENLYYDQSKFLPKQSFRASFTSYPNTTRPRHNLYPDNFHSQLSYLPDPYKFNQHFPSPIQLSSQTPYGPHVPAPPAPSAQQPQLPIQQNTPNTAANGEEISTIFVVGFPEDMQEREFQNMFTFSAGFEAATLKIPNKEYTAYGSLVGGPPGTSIANGLGMRGGAFQYAGPNDPYNLVTVNQGGVVVDGGRDGTMASWPAPTSADDLSNGHYLGAGPGGAAALGLGPLGLAAAAGMGATTLSLPPRKQIIGFAKFRSREEALAARDILQGRRVDIEKGAVLKAEMAKKNLHTKRGVGPVPGVGIGIGGLQQQQQHMNGLSVTGMDAFNTEFPPTTSSNRDSLPALARIGWRDSILPGSQGQGQPDSSNPASNALQSNGAHVNGREDDDRKRDSLLSMGLGGLNLASNSTTSSVANATGQRGPRERAEDDEWRRKEKEKEMNLMRLRANNAAAFDAFHGVPASASANANGAGAPGMSRQSSTASTSSGSVVGGGGSNSGLWTAAPTASTVPTESVAASSPMLGDAEAEQRDEEDAKQETEDEVVGPWDRFSKVNMSYAAVTRPVGGAYSANGAQHHATESERSTSPAPSVPAPSAFGYQGGVEGGQQQYHTPPLYQPQYLHLHEQQQQAAHQQHMYEQQQQQQQHLYQSVYSHHLHGQQQPFRSSQSESSETGSVVGADSSPSANNNPNINPIGYVGARLGYSTGFGSVSVLSSSSNARDPVSVSNTAGASASLSKSPGSGFSFGSMTQGSGRVGGEVYTSLTTANAGAGMLRSLSSANGVANGSGASSTSTSAVSPPAGVATSTGPASTIDSTPATTNAASATSNVNGVVGGPAMSSGSSSGGSVSGSVNGSGGNTSPQLPSPASAAGSGVSAGSAALPPGSTSGSVHVRGTVDQNPPINTLYVGNLPTSPLPLGYSNDYLEETLRALFSACPGFRKLCFRQKANGPMCFIEFVDVQQATDALKVLSGNTLGGIVKNGIRLSYSKNPLGVRTPTSAGGNSGGPTLQQQQQLVQTLNNHHHHHQYNHQQPQPQQHQMNPPPPSATSSNSSDTFQTRLAEESAGGHVQQQQQQHRLPTAILRRDSTLSPTTMSSLAQAQASYMSGNGNSGNVNGNSFFSSPPPRFYTTSPGMPFGTSTSTSSSTPLTGASSAFIPRSAANGGPGGLFNIGVGGYAGGGGGGVQTTTAPTTTAFSPFGMSFAAAAAAAHHENAFVPQHQHQQQQVPHLPQLSIPGDQRHQPQSLADN